MPEPPAKRSKPSTPGTSTPKENPYLCVLPPTPATRRDIANASAHLGAGQSSASGSNGVAQSNGKVANPLAGLVPRKVTVEQAKAIMVSPQLHVRRKPADIRTASTTRSRASRPSRRSTRRSCSSARRCRCTTRCTSSSRSSRTTRSQ